jgi:hypothetical protein
LIGLEKHDSFLQSFAKVKLQAVACISLISLSI